MRIYIQVIWRMFNLFMASKLVLKKKKVLLCFDMQKTPSPQLRKFYVRNLKLDYFQSFGTSDQGLFTFFPWLYNILLYLCLKMNVTSSNSLYLWSLEKVFKLQLNLNMLLKWFDNSFSQIFIVSPINLNQKQILKRT